MGLVVDCFAGGGGASTGIERALGRSPDIAVNHDPEAVAMHAANHPATRHLCGDVWDVDPLGVTAGRPVDFAWFSPDCTHFSKAKGGKPRSTKRRALAWVVVRWAREVKPAVIALENVEEFLTWGPLDAAGQPCTKRKGRTFRMWIGKLRALGYVVEWRQLRACDYGAPTTRRRLFLIARCDGQPIVWPEPTHGPGRLPYRTAGDCIDWSLPCPSIFDRKKPLSAATMRRIARGIGRFVTGEKHPYLVPDGSAVATLIQTSYGERKGQAPRVPGLELPLGTVVAGGSKHALVVGFLAKHYGGRGTPGSSLGRPIDAITCKDHHALVAALLEENGYAGPGHYNVVDIGMRHLTPRERFCAQGFPADYVIAPIIGTRKSGKPKRLRPTAQGRMVGNSAPPDVVAAIVRANVGDRQAVAA